ncbi:MAG: hypothetical protein PBV01_21040 [Brucella anthropi]
MSGAVELCTCEGESHGDLGAVQDAERLARIVFSPNHLRKTGELKPGVFPLSHIKKSGVSLLRVDHLTRDELKERSDETASQLDGQSVHGLLVTRATQIRSLTESAHRSVCLVDDPVLNDPKLSDNPAHAICISPLERSDDQLQEIQADLLDIFSDVLSIDDAHAFS